MKVLMAVDGSPSSWHMLEETLRILPLKEADVSVVTIAARPRIGTDPIGYDVAYIPVMAEIRSESEQALKAAQRMLEAGGVTARTILREGEPESEILALAEEFKPDLICIGSHGRGAFGRFMMGSLSDALVHRWQGAVMVIRQPESVAKGPSRSVKSVMTGHPLSVQSDQMCDAVARLMRDLDTGFVPVMEAGALIGVITDRDIVIRVLAAGLDPVRTQVGRVCTKPAVWIAPGSPLEDAADLMERYHIRRLAVLDGADLVGVIALGDLAETVPEVAEHALVEISKSVKTLAHG